ncbi:2-hydroxyacid dehydrogenase [Blastopirellula sp. JC732]|uniref:2-hydroxyacid dehydrogenase n=1 Tax=Blastopirellula sediminis TaxID=2894196 RepID=A0A9X1MML1_9BACT|nr:2-hydroxyacid dehydrogenase [Blastopirellula sediminis]MCC9606785.1 2-hydroxyacid dehydrogenase [Blastopirellula sediminis]MCC9629918.1 2-hydroxyacid dehydrogenase [Blastopirellula sediminis]
MQVAVFSTKSYDREFLLSASTESEICYDFFEERLTQRTVVLARDFPAVCCFVNDELSASVIEAIAAGGTKMIALRCAGFNNCNLHAAAEHGVKVARVPAYSPYAVAEHTVGLILTLNRKFHKAYNRVREGNFALQGMLGFDLHGKTIGVVGTGKIGQIAASILQGFGCRILAFDVHQNPECVAAGVEYVELDQLFAESDVVTLHCPLLPSTKYLVNEASIAKMKPGVMLINTSRGGLVDAKAVIEGLKTGQIGYVGLDVYEEEADLFFEDRSELVIQDDVFSRLLTFPNVLITGHQAFFTRNALEAISQVTTENLRQFLKGEKLANEVVAS